MSKLRWTGPVALLLIASLAVLGSAAAKIYTAQAAYDFGEVLEGYTVSNVFVIENQGDSTLQIVRVRSSCGCTTTDLATNFLEPGESVELEVLVDTSGFGGSISKSVYVESNDPETPRLVLRMFGVVNRAQPYHISVNDLSYLFYALVDLRSAEDFAAGHLNGAISIPYAELADSLELIPSGVLLIVYDQTGEFGDLAAQMLIGANYPEARSLYGGLDQWLRSFETKYIIPANAELTIPDGWAQGGMERYHLPVGDMNYLMYVLVDIRTEAEYEFEHLLGALHIPHDELVDRMNELPKGVTLVLYDTNGEQADEAAQMLQASGFTQARSLLGGLIEWMRAQGTRFLTSSQS